MKSKKSRNAHHFCYVGFGVNRLRSARREGRSCSEQQEHGQIR